MKHDRKSGSRRFAWLGGIVLIAVLAIAAARVLFGFHPMFEGADWPTRFQSNGERIYFTASSASGLAIGSTGENMHMSMMGGSCVTCHGVDRQGGRMMPRFWTVAPPLTPAALFGDHAKSDGHGDHDAYSDETVGRAITEGTDPDGEPLDPAMPRWSMSSRDLADLIAYLKSPVDEPR